MGILNKTTAQINAILAELGIESGENKLQLINGAVVGTKSISSGVVSIERNLTQLNAHGFDDYTTLNIDSDQGVSGYSAFDAYLFMNNSVPVNHFTGYQARQNFIGTADVSGIVIGHSSSLVHNSQSLLTNYYGLNVDQVTFSNSGRINRMYGLRIGDFSSGGIIESHAIHIDGGEIYGGNKISLNGTSPQFFFQNTSAGVDQKISDILVGTNNFVFRFVNDANSAASTFMQVNRSGYNPTSINFPSGAPVNVTGKVQATSFNANGSDGVDGSFTSSDGKTVTVTKGLITSIV